MGFILCGAVRGGEGDTRKAMLTLSGPLDSIQCNGDSGGFHGAYTTQIESIQAEIESLSGEDFARLAAWIAERDWQNWDRQIERDSAAGKLDFMREEAKQHGKLRDL